jgi:hypothetical protein
MTYLSASAPEPAWWQAWLAASEARLPTGMNPFGIVSTDGTLSDFILPVTWRREMSVAPLMRELLRSLATIQTARQVAIAYAEQCNYTDLQSGLIVLDARLMHTCPYRPQASLTERLDILSGLCLHEALHIEYSSAELCQRAQTHGQLFAHVHNILEDEYIESQLPRTSPGYAGYVHATRSYMFDDAHRSMVRQDHSLLNIFLLFVRYPKRIRWQEVGPFHDVLDQIRRILTPFPTSNLMVYQAAEQIVQLLEAHQQTGPEPTMALRIFLEAAAQHRLPKRDLLELADRMLSGRGSRRAPRHSPSAGSAAEPQLQSAIGWSVPDNNRQCYDRDRHMVKPYIQRLRRWLQAWEVQGRGGLSWTARGRLEWRQLHSIPQGNTRLFHRPDAPRARPLTLALLIDESGSMAGEKITAARQVAILFKEALATVNNIELYIFGHSADMPPSTTTIFRYWAPGWKRSYSLGSVSARKNNRDGVALWAVAHEVKRCAKHRAIVLLVLSDGQPHAAGYQDEAAIAHTRSIVQRLQREMVVIQIAIDTALDSQRMFDHYLRFTNLASLPTHMERLLRKLLI